MGDHLAAERIELLDLLVGLGRRKSHRLPDRILRRHVGDSRQRLSYAQERLWFLERFGFVGTAYSMPAALWLGGELNVEALECSIGEVLRRHESLRTRFEEDGGGGCVQVIDAAGEFRLEVVDLCGLGEEEREAQARRLARLDAERLFDLARGPLFRAQLLRLGAAAHVVLVNMHHIVSDGWSQGILIREIGLLYAAYVEGRASPLAGCRFNMRIMPYGSASGCRARCWRGRLSTGSNGWAERLGRWRCRRTGRGQRYRATAGRGTPLHCRGSFRLACSI